MPHKYVTPQNQVLPLIVIAVKNDSGTWEKYTCSYRPEYIKTVVGALNNHHKFKSKRYNIRTFEIASGLSSYIDEALIALNGPTPHI